MLLHFFSRRRREREQTLFRNFVFGVEDSLVSTVGLLSGVATAETSQQVIITTGVVLIFVEAFSMGVGSFLSEETAGQVAHHATPKREIVRAALVMFVSYFSAGFVPLIPYLLLPHDRAVAASIGVTLVALTLLGVISARRFRGNLFYKGLEMLVMGGLATLIGIAVGSLLG